VSARLAEVDALPHEAAGRILEGCTCCSVAEFRDMHKLLSTTERIHQIRVAGGKGIASSPSLPLRSFVTKLVSFSTS
jgi:hypothetical protein